MSRSNRQLIIIDSQVNNWQGLANDVGNDNLVLILDPSSDGLTQISDYLTTLSTNAGAEDFATLKSIHIISHGSAGRLLLGSSTITSDNLNLYIKQLATLGSSLTESGDILFYGCNVGQGGLGLQFVNTLAQLTCADVAASQNLTGSTVLGGDWILETGIGIIEAQTLQLPAYASILANNTAPTFAVDGGKVTSNFYGSGSSVTLQPDGKIVVAGNFLVRYNTDGSLDTSFSSDGKVASSVGNDPSLAMQSDGKILIAGTSNADFALARYNTDGSLDTSFSSGGMVTSDFGGIYESGYSVSVQADGKILVTGDRYYNNHHYFALVRYNTDGSLDTTFSAGNGSNGKIITYIGGYGGSGYSITEQADGKILVAGTSYNGSNSFNDQPEDFALARYNTDGSLDTSFSGDGMVTTDFGSSDRGYSVTVQTDGKILVAGSTSGRNLALARYNTDGFLDTSFSGDGKVTTSIVKDTISVNVQSDGKILVAGTSYNDTNSDFALVRYNTDGSLDTSFSGDGMVTTDFSGYYDSAYSVTVQPDGKIVVVGRSLNGNTNQTTVFALARYNSDGSLDTSFKPAYQVFNENGIAVLLADNVHIYDAELAAIDNYAGTTVTIMRHGGTNAEDLFSVKHGGTLGVLTEGMAVVVGGITVGTVSKNSGGTLVLAFNSNANQNLTNSVLQQIAYSNNSENPPGSVQVDWSISDGNTTGSQGLGGTQTTTGYTTVNIIPTNDAPILLTPMAANYTDTVGDDIFGSTSGNLSGSDLEGDNLTYGISGGIDNGTAVSKIGNYGTLTVTKATGIYTFIPNDTAIEALTAETSENYTITVSDGVAITNAIYTVNLTGANDTGTLAAPNAASYTDTAGDDNFSTSTGNLTLTSSSGGALIYGITNGTDNGTEVTKTGSYGILTVTKATGVYTFTPNKTAVEALAANASENYTVTVSGSRDTPSALYTVNLIGANDTPSLVKAIISYSDTPIHDIFSSTSGVLIGNDKEGDAITYGISGGTDNGTTVSKTGTYGTLTVTKSNGAYTFVPNDTPIEPWSTNSSENYSVTVSDNFSSASSTLTVKIAGVNDAPVFVVGDGKVTTDIVTDSIDRGASLVLQSDGKILVAGTSGNDFALVRYNSNGSLDTTFSGDGKLTTDIVSGTDSGESVTLQSDGKILVAGSSFNSTNTYDFALVRYNTNGSLDTTFSGDGKLTTDIATGTDQGQSVTLQTDGKILVAGSSTNNFALVRYNSDGSLDLSFGDEGKFATNSYGNSVAVQADGKILVAGSSYNSTNNYDFALVRYNTNGSLDTTFSGDGKLTTDIATGTDQGQSVTLQTDGKILVAGRSINSTTNNNDFALVRYNTNGSLDTTFSGDGKLTTDIVTGSIDWGASVTLQSDGKILIAGTSGNDFALVRYKNNGSLDTTFSGDGKLTTDLVTGSIDWGASVTLQSDGKILVAGTSGNDFALVRYNVDGSLDETFNVPSTSLLYGKPIYTENSSAVVLDSSVVVTDAELASQGSYSGASLTLVRHGGANSEDVFSASGNLSPITQGGVLVLSGTIIGAVTQKSGGVLVLTFNVNATQALVNETLSSIAYANSSDNPTATVQIDWTFSDGNTGNQGIGQNLTATGHTTVLITPINDAPNGTSTTIGLSINSPHVFTLTDFGFRDAEDTSLSAVRIDSVPTSGGLLYGGASLISGLTISAADITAGLLTFNPSQIFSGGQTVQFDFSVKDSAGLYDTTENTLTITIDSAAPTISSYSPSDGASGVATNSNIVFTFGEAIQRGTGDLIIFNGNGTVAKTIAVADTSQVSVAGSSVIINPNTNLAAGSSYFLNMAAGVLKDLAGNSFAGIAGTTAYNFSTHNDAPTLTAFTSAVASGNEDSSNTVSFANLQSKGNEADVDGTVTAFVIKAVSSGSLKIGPSVATATAWAAGSNNVVDATHQAYWTPAANANGTLNAFTAVAKDDGGLVSSTAIQAKISITAVNDAPALTKPTAINYIDTVFDDSFETITGLLVSNDIDSNTLTYGIAGGTDNGLTISKSSTYGVLTVTKATGAYSFVAKNAAIEALTVAASTSFTVTVSDGLLSNSKTLTINIAQSGTTESNGNDTLTGTSGNDKFDGLAGNDIINGMAGDDIINGGLGNGTLNGGLGNDIYVINVATDIVTELAGQGTDLIQSTVSYSLVDTDGAGTNGGNVENLRVMGTSAINATGNSLSNILYANTDNNVLNGGAGVDTASYQFGASSAGVNVSLANALAQTTFGSGSDKLIAIENLTGSNYNDRLTGDGNGNVLNGLLGNDTLIGGLGNDTYVINVATDIVTELAGQGIDLIQSTVSYNLVDTDGAGANGGNVENLTLKGTAAINGTGNALNNTLTGNTGANTLNGGAGDDSLIGGLGNDNLTGGLGADKFKFNAVAETGITATTRDIITDFKHSQVDKIDLSAIDANTALIGNDAFSAPTVGGTFSGVFTAPGKLYFDQTAHVLYGNNDADSSADFSIQLTGVSSLVSGDFVL